MASRGSTVSLDDLLVRDDVRVGYKLVDGNLGRAGKKVTLPLYLAAFLFDGGTPLIPPPPEVPTA